MANAIVCSPKFLPKDRWISAANRAIEINPANRPMLERLPMVTHGFAPTPQSIAVVTGKYWHGNRGVDLTVSFMDGAAPVLRKRIVQHMNAWATTSNVTFRETSGQGQVRIAFEPDGYWSYLGTDILSIEPNKQTMNLEGFTMQTAESEFIRVVRHETGHTLGCPHEHMRRELVQRIDPQKAYTHFLQTQGWDKAMVDAQVLTPLEDGSLLRTTFSDEKSIMCYQIPGTLTKNGQPILGGPDIDKSDYDFMATIYPKKAVPAKPAKKKPAKKNATTKKRPTRKKVAKRGRQRPKHR